MAEILFIIGIICIVIAGCCFIASVAMFFGFNIPTLWKDWNGTLEQKQIDEIRIKNSQASNQRGKVNVFEELEKKAKVKKPNTQSLNIGATTSPKKQFATDAGTSVLNNNIVNPDFIIEKNIMFVSTSEVI